MPDCALGLGRAGAVLLRVSRRPFRQAGNVTGMPDALYDSHYLRACRGEAVSQLPIWLMRQAGRYMQEYRVVRDEHGFMALCREPELACKVTVEAQQILGVDVAIIFADILLILEGFGQDLTFTEGKGPSLSPPLRDPAQIDELLGDPLAAAESCRCVAESCRLTRAALPPDVPLIGFSGAPFTLAAYAIEAGGSRQFAATRQFMYNHPEAFHALQAKLATAIVPYLRAQVEAGAQALQIFDSWVGQLTEADYREFVLPHLQAIIAELPEGIPVTVFGTGTGHLLEAIAESGCDVVGVDTTTDLLAARERLGDQVTVQGNLDPAWLLGPEDRLLARVDEFLAAAGSMRGLIVNLGHGVMKETNPTRAKALVDRIHAYQP